MKLFKLFILLFCLNLNAQSSWQSVPNIVSNTNNQRFDDVFFLNDNLGWAANGSFAAVYKTTDGGLTWSEQLNETDLSGNFYFRNIEFLNNNVGFIGTLNGTFFKTIDGGTSWTEVTNITPNPQAICGLNTIGTSTIYGCGAYFEPAFIIKSTDSGLTWQYIDMSAHANALVEIYFLSETVGFASGRSDNGANILKTTDGGITWTEIYNSNITGEYVWKLQVLDSNPNVIFGAVEAFGSNLGQLIKSTNGGITWSSYNAPETAIQAVGFINENHGWMGGHTTGFHETLDGGATWTNLNIGNNLNRIFVINSTLAYAAGTTVYKYTDQTLGTSSPTLTYQPSLDIKILNNPIQSNLEFTIDFKSNNNLLIELYDNTGKYIKRLTREQIASSELKQYNYNLEDLPSGIYFVDFHYNSGKVSKKIIKK